MVLTFVLVTLALSIIILWLSVKIIMKSAEIDMIREHICYDKKDLQNAWNGGYVEGVNSEFGHNTKTFHEWYQMHKFTKKYGKK